MGEMSFKVIGRTLTWAGEGVEETGTDQNGNVVVRVDPKYFRPTEVDLLLGDATKAKKKLGWTPKIGLEEMCKEMVDSDLKDYEEKTHLQKRRKLGAYRSSEVSEDQAPSKRRKIAPAQDGEG